MGEVRTQVKLTNYVDLEMFRRGLLKNEEIRSIITDAMVDTGAVRSVIPLIMMKELGIEIFKETTAEYANGYKENVGLIAGLMFEIEDRFTTDDAFVLGNEVLIGQTVLEKMDLLVDCTSQKLIPNPKHPDGPVSKIK